jgi:hypothetical protein
MRKTIIVAAPKRQFSHNTMGFYYNPDYAEKI